MPWLAGLPTTQLRVVVTLAVFVGTAIRYWWSGEAPDGDWLLFLAGMAGVDALTVIGKRAATKPDAIRAEGEAAVRRIEATAAAVPPLTPEAALRAGQPSDPEPELVSALKQAVQPAARDHTGEEAP